MIMGRQIYHEEIPKKQVVVSQNKTNKRISLFVYNYKPLFFKLVRPFSYFWRAKPALKLLKFGIFWHRNSQN